MADLIIVLGLFFCAVWLIYRTVLMIARIDLLKDIPSQHFDPITTYIQENYGSHFQDENKSVEESLRKL